MRVAMCGTGLMHLSSRRKFSWKQKPVHANPIKPSLKRSSRFLDLSVEDLELDFAKCGL